MKTIKFIGMALFAILMCVNFTSCSKEDNRPQYNLITSGKKIVKIEGISSSGYSLLWEFKYDKDGKLIEAIEKDETHEYSWGNQGNNTIDYWYILDGLIVGSDYQEIIYSNQRITKVKIPGGYGYEYNFSWNNDKLTQMYRMYKEENRARINYHFSFFYDTNVATCTNFNPIFPILASEAIGDSHDFGLCVAHPELIGVRTTQLPNRFIYTDYYWDDNDYEEEKRQGTFLYKFDNDGYVIECIMRDNEGPNFGFGFYNAEYTITWE